MRAVTGTSLKIVRFVHFTESQKDFLPDTCTFHHIGSTSVPGMPAKDIIDLDIEYVPGSLFTVITGLKKAGYSHEGDLGIAGREAFIKESMEWAQKAL
jgi:GrpB-like predicted nucleotidyltransferase (UPF0157 family)